VLDNAEPRKGIEVVSELRASSDVQAYRRSHENTAGEGPEPCSRSREYRWRKKTWKARSRDGGPKYMNVVISRQY
jgi:hypothetical protein